MKIRLISQLLRLVCHIWTELLEKLLQLQHIRMWNIKVLMVLIGSLLLEIRKVWLRINVEELWGKRGDEEGQTGGLLMWKKTCRWLARQRKKQRKGSGRMTGRPKKISFKITLASSWSSWYPFIYSFLLLLFSSCTSPTFSHYPANTLTQSPNSLWNTFDFYWFVWSNMYWFMSMVVESRLLQFVLLWE